MKRDKKGEEQMKREIKRCICKSVVAVLALMTVSLHTPEAATLDNSDTSGSTASYEVVRQDVYQASSLDKKAKNAYKRYVRNYLSSKQRFPEHKYRFGDINNDGISEMFYSYSNGMKYAYKVYTYKKGKIIKMGDFKGCNFITYSKSQKQICVLVSDGAFHSIPTCYKMIGSRLKQSSKYEMISDYSNNSAKYYKNNKRISKKKFDKFFNKVLKWPSV